jgi:anti-sigma factor RsiW
VYVLGAIEPAERALVDAHLAVCQECREELADLAGLPALLHRVPVAEAQRLAAEGAGPAALAPPSDQLLNSLLARTARVRRTRRWRAIAAAAAVIVVALGGGAAGAVAVQGAGGGSPPVAAQRAWHTVSGSGPQTTAAVTVRYAARSWGTAMDVRVGGIPAGTVCELRVTDARGHSWVVGGWQVSYHSEGTWYPAASSLPATDLRSFEISSGGKVLASVPVR